MVALLGQVWNPQTVGRRCWISTDKGLKDHGFGVESASWNKPVSLDVEAVSPGLSGTVPAAVSYDQTGLGRILWDSPAWGTLPWLVSIGLLQGPRLCG